MGVEPCRRAEALLGLSAAEVVAAASVVVVAAVAIVVEERHSRCSHFVAFFEAQRTEPGSSCRCLEESLAEVLEPREIRESSVAGSWAVGSSVEALQFVPVVAAVGIADAAVARCGPLAR